MNTSSNPLDTVYDAALSGDMARGLARLDAIPEASLTDAQRETAACLRARFGAAPPPLPPGLPPRTAGILGAYQDYWRSSLLRLASVREAEAALLSELNRQLPASAPDLDSATDAVRETVEAEGLHALTGMTLPYYELMLWRTHTPTTYAVALPEQQVDVTVVFLDDFVSLGWAGFATCGRSHTGGWATATALYAVRSGYDLDSEQFRVSYLAHEGQHFADYRRFPKLAQPELEYRAKLTELAQADATTHDLVTRFAARTGADRNVPHSFANYRVTRDVGRLVFDAEVTQPDALPWRQVSRERVNAAAHALLVESTRRLDALGAATVEQYLA